MEYGSKQILRLAILAAGAVSLMGCQAFRDASGLGKEQPDEFAVVTKAPLIMPPDYNLRPPRDGAPPVNQVAPTDSAQAALFDSTDPAAAAKAMPGDYSQAEKLLLAQANAANPDPSIRQEVASDGRAMEPANDTFAEQVLFWQGPATTGHGRRCRRRSAPQGCADTGGRPGRAQPAPKKSLRPTPRPSTRKTTTRAAGLIGSRAALADRDARRSPPSAPPPLRRDAAPQAFSLRCRTECRCLWSPITAPPSSRR